MLVSGSVDILVQSLDLIIIITRRVPSNCNKLVKVESAEASVIRLVNK